MGIRDEKTAGPKPLAKLHFGNSGNSDDRLDLHVAARGSGGIPRNIVVSGLAVPFQTSSAFPGEKTSAVHRRKIDLPNFENSENCEDAASSAGAKEFLRTFNTSPGVLPRQGDTSRDALQQVTPPGMARRGQSLLLTLAVGAVVAVGAAGFYFIEWPGLQAGSPPSSATAAASPTPQILDPVPTVQPLLVALEPKTLEPAVVMPAMQTPVPAFVEPKSPAPSVTPPDRRPLSQDDVLETQVRLKSFGFDPGPLDGIVGPRTMAAVDRYEIARGRQPTGDLDREVLGRLRQDPTEPTLLAQPAAMRER